MSQEALGSNAMNTIGQLREIALPIAERFGMSSEALFGSYGSGEADEGSDIDPIMDHGNHRIKRIFAVSGEVEEATGKGVDVYAWSELLPGEFQDSIRREAIML